MSKAPFKANGLDANLKPISGATLDVVVIGADTEFNAYESQSQHFVGKWVKYTGASAAVFNLPQFPKTGDIIIIERAGGDTPAGAITFNDAFFVISGFPLINVDGHFSTAGPGAVVSLVCSNDGQWQLLGKTAA